MGYVIYKIIKVIKNNETQYIAGLFSESDIAHINYLFRDVVVNTRIDVSNMDKLNRAFKEAFRDYEINTPSHMPRKTPYDLTEPNSLAMACQFLKETAKQMNERRDA